MISVAGRASWGAGAPLRAALIALIRVYRVTAGLLLSGQCRFHPSCSSYAEQAIRQLGWIRGSLLAAWRIARCNPFSAGGVDYPPLGSRRAPHLYDDVTPRQYDAAIPGARRGPGGTTLEIVEGLDRHGAGADGESS
jgi:putative membrane protein insertion efficiency factor